MLVDCDGGASPDVHPHTATSVSLANIPERPAESGLTAAAAAALVLPPEVSAAPAEASLSAAAPAGAAGALTDAGVDAAAELVAEPGEGFLGVGPDVAPKRSESSSLSGSA